MGNGRAGFGRFWPFGKRVAAVQPDRVEMANPSRLPISQTHAVDGMDLQPDRIDGVVPRVDPISQTHEVDGTDLRPDRVDGVVPRVDPISQTHEVDGTDLRPDRIDGAIPRMEPIWQPHGIDGQNLRPDRIEGATRNLDPIVRERIDVKQLGTSIYNGLDRRCVGFAIRIREQGKTVFEQHAGYAQMPVDGNKLFTQSTKITIASVGKFFTAMAAVRLLDDEPGVGLTTPIGAYLPPAWIAAETVKTLTFLDLLTHKSGLGFHIELGAGENDVSLVRRAVYKGPSDAPGYHNANYILIRLLMYELLNRRSANPYPPVVAPAFDGHTIPDWRPSDRALQDASAAVYDEYLQATLFRPAGAFAAFAAPEDRAFHYHWPYDGEKGALDDVAFAAGSGGWYMSAAGVLRAAGAVRRGNILLSPERARQALDLGIGIDFSGDLNAPSGAVLGRICGKGGLSLLGPKGREQAHAAWLLLLPDGIEVAILANSRFENSPAMSDLWGLAAASIRPWNSATGFD
jgi:CubicO group peptidase (beta-lactamase class C family)